MTLLCCVSCVQHGPIVFQGDVAGRCLQVTLLCCVLWVAWPCRVSGRCGWSLSASDVAVLCAVGCMTLSCFRESYGWSVSVSDVAVGCGMHDPVVFQGDVVGRCL